MLASHLNHAIALARPLLLPPVCTMQVNESSGSDLPYKALLLAVAVGYGTNFPVGRLMNEALPAAATTSGRFTLAALALSPFIPRLDKRLILPAVGTGVCDAIGYCAQSLALVDTPAAKVSFLGTLTVVHPLLRQRSASSAR